MATVVMMGWENVKVKSAVDMMARRMEAATQTVLKPLKSIMKPRIGDVMADTK